MCDQDVLNNSFGCDDCGAQFQDIKTFMAHRKIHFATSSDIQSKEKDILDGVCPSCNLTFYVKTLSPKAFEEFQRSKNAQKERKNGKFKIRECRYCFICEISFPNAIELLKHSRDVHGIERPYQCKKCDFTTSFFHHIKRHSYVHKKTKLFNCHLCPKGYSTKTSLDGHLLMHPEVNIKSYDCEICGKKFPIPFQLKRHLKTHEPTGKIFKCDLCSKEFAWRNSLRLHILTHTGERPYQCQICKSGFTQAFKYRRHMKVHNQIIGTVIDCELCDKQFHTPYLLKNHMLVHDKDAKFICDICSKPFLREANLILHKKTHTGNAPYDCGDCGKKFTKRSAYTRHRLIHIKPNEDPVECEYCGKNFAAMYRLERHIKIHTRDRDDLHKCDICSKLFTRKQSLKDHLLLHEGKEPFSCIHCDKKFIKQKQLKVHLDPGTRKSTKPFRCKLCSRTFPTKSCYIFHRRIHKKEYNCEACGKKFLTRFALKKHLNVHVKNEAADPLQQFVIKEEI